MNQLTLVEDTTVVAAVSKNSKTFNVSQGQVVAWRSTNFDGAAVATLYYDGPDNTINPAIDQDGNAVTITVTNPEGIINIPGRYRVAQTAAATTAGTVFIDY